MCVAVIVAMLRFIWPIGINVFIPARVLAFMGPIGICVHATVHVLLCVELVGTCVLVPARMLLVAGPTGIYVIVPVVFVLHWASRTLRSCNYSRVYLPDGYSHRRRHARGDVLQLSDNEPKGRGDADVRGCR